jgi:hypothetical protein
MAALRTGGHEFIVDEKNNVKIFNFEKMCIITSRSESDVEIDKRLCIQFAEDLNYHLLG